MNTEIHEKNNIRAFVVPIKLKTMFCIRHQDYKGKWFFFGADINEIVIFRIVPV